MGAWGTALFSDDTACDVREDYRDCIGDGLSGPQATDRLLDEWKSSVDDPDEGGVFWLALAVTQWKCGRLEPRVQERALQAIASGSDLRRWADNPKLLRKRSSELAKLEQLLRSPPPPEKRIPKRFRDHCDWEIGELIGYQLRSGSWTLLRVIEYHTDKGGTAPVCEALEWVGTDFPALEVLKTLPVRRTIANPPDEVTRFMIGRTSERELPKDRVRRLGIKLEPAQKRPQNGGRPVVWPIRVYLWRWLDKSLERDFGIA